jgi:hypothetical protein
MHFLKFITLPLLIATPLQAETALYCTAQLATGFKFNKVENIWKKKI